MVELFTVRSGTRRWIYPVYHMMYHVPSVRHPCKTRGTKFSYRNPTLLVRHRHEVKETSNVDMPGNTRVRYLCGHCINMDTERMRSRTYRMAISSSVSNESSKRGSCLSGQ